MTSGRALVWLALVGCGCTTTTTPLSVELRYSADAAPVAQAEALAGARIGVGRFADSRQLLGNDMHAASFVAHDGNYDLGVTWQGRTFAPVPVVVQALLIEELRHAGLSAEPIDAVVPPGDVAAARAAGERDHVDVVLGGDIHDLTNGLVAFDAALIEVAGGRSLMHQQFKGTFPTGDSSLTAQQRVDEVLNHSFRSVAHQMVSQLAKQLSGLIAAGTTETAPESKP